MIEDRDSPAPASTSIRNKSTESMLIDDDDNNSSPTEGPFRLVVPPDNSSRVKRSSSKLSLPDDFSNLESSPLPSFDVNDEPLTTKDFNYTMTALDNKINLLYKFCKYIANQQDEMKVALTKLVALDELSDNFWNVSS